MKINIIGCGLAGATSARILKDAGHEIKIFEKRDHIGGNCYDVDIMGVNVHKYGPHIFHTDDEEVFEFLSRFTEWMPFELKPKGNSSLGMISLPYSKKTISELGRELSQEEIMNVIFKDYSEKQWGTSFDNIPSTITNRIPKTKDCDDPTWFEGQKYQCIPKNGYTKMFDNMLSDIEIRLNCSDDDWKNEKCDLLIYTGSIDQYFNYKFGRLPYRSLEFKHSIQNKGMDYFIENQNNKLKYTRKYDHSFLTLNPPKDKTVITHEYPKECGEFDTPYYPIPFGEGLKIYNEYLKLANQENDVIFLGRLAQYKYLDMWMVIKHVLLKLKDYVK
jgi:UDP-galactopyranose mutase